MYQQINTKSYASAWFQNFDVPADPTAVIAEIEALLMPESPLDAAWSPGEVNRDGTAPFLRYQNDLTLNLSLWGRREGQFTDPYVDGDRTHERRRGAVPVSAIYLVTPEDQATRRGDILRLTIEGQDWFWVGSSWNGVGSKGAEFAVCTWPPELDFSIQGFRCQPAIIPRDRLAVWLSPQTNVNHRWPDDGGTLRIERVSTPVAPVKRGINLRDHPIARPSRLELTEAMIEAGASAISADLRRCEAPVGGSFSAHGLAERVYRTMVLAQRSG